MNLILFLLIGLLSGWLAGKIFRGRGFGIAGNLAVGVLGAIIGGWLFSLLDLRATGLTGELIASLVGALVLLWVINLVRK